MEIYLPIAEMSVNWAMILGMGGAVGFLSGMFGVGGGFLMTPLLIFYGIPPGVAVATQASHITASSFSGVLAQFRRGAVDAKMGLVLLGGGVIGSWIGVGIFRLLRETGQVEFVISAGYVLLLGSIGALMLNESVRVLRAARGGARTGVHRAGQHNWIHGLPLKMRFRRSKLYTSVIPPIILGFVVGILTAILGVGGGFVLVPAMIYLLKMPTNVVVGTSLFQILFVAAAATILHASNNYTVDIILGSLLILGGVVGAQFGARIGAKLRGEQLRALLALLVLVVGVRLLIGLVTTPADIYSLASGIG